MKNTNFSIISGKYKGLKISGKLSKSVRPTSSLVRKSIFDTLRNIENLPNNAKKYIYAVEDFIEAKISSISTSPEREDTILVENPFA